MTDPKALREKLDAMVWDKFRSSGDADKVPSRKQAVSIALDLLREKEKRETPWIPCSERLPAVGQVVVCYRPLARESADNPLAVDVFMGRMHKSPQGVEHGFDRYCHPTHWMPLPDPPVQVKQKEEQ